MGRHHRSACKYLGELMLSRNKHCQTDRFSFWSILIFSFLQPVGKRRQFKFIFFLSNWNTCFLSWVHTETYFGTDFNWGLGIVCSTRENYFVNISPHDHIMAETPSCDQTRIGKGECTIYNLSHFQLCDHFLSLLVFVHQLYQSWGLLTGGGLWLSISFATLILKNNYKR